MSVSNSEKSRRRRILYRSLDDGTPVEIVQLAIDLLDNEFGSQSEMSYKALINRLKESSDHNAFRSANLLGRIMMVRNKPVEQIGPDPSDPTGQPGGGASKAAPSVAKSKRPVVVLEGRDLVFNTLLQHVTASIVKHKPDSETSYREHFINEILKLNLSQNCGKKLVSWAKSNESISAISGSDKDLHKIINTAFVWMCQKFGPVLAEKLLLQAVKLTEQLPESFEDSPRKFL